MLAEHFGGADGERRIEEDRRRRNLAALHQVDQIDDQFLRALDREGRDEQRAAARMRRAHLRGEMLRGAIARHRRAVLVAIGRFADDVVEPGRRFRIGLQQLGVGAEIAGGQHAQRLAGFAFAGEFDLDRGRAEQMAGVPVARAHARHGLDPVLVIDRPEGIERGDRVALRVDRRHRRRPRAALRRLSVSDFRFLDAAGIGQHEGAQIDGAARRQDRPAEAAARQLGHQAAVVDMRVRQQHGVDVGRVERKVAVVQLLQRLRPLEQAAIDQQAPGRRLEQIWQEPVTVRAAPQKRRVTLMRPISLRSASARIRIERDGVGRMRHAVGGIDRADAGREEGVRQFRRKQRMGDDGIDRGRAGRAQRLGAGDQRAARGDDIVDQQRRPAVEQRRIGEMRSRPNGRRAASCARPRVRAPSRPARSATQGRDSSSGPTTTVRGSTPIARRVSAIAGTAERSSASMPGKTSSICSVRCRCASTVIDAVERVREQVADHLLADRLALMKGRVLPHVAKIGRDQHQPLGAAAPQGFRPRTTAPAACRSARSSEA